MRPLSGVDTSTPRYLLWLKTIGNKLIIFKNNVRFAKTIEPENAALIQYEQEISTKAQTIPSSIGQEKQINPFLRAHLPDIEAKMNAQGFESLAELRRRKDEF